MFKKLKSLFVIEDEATASAAKAQNTPDVKKSADTKSTGKPQASKSSQPASSNEIKAAAAKGKPDEKFINRLLGALEQHNIDGFDYLEYKQSLQNLGKVDMDEATRFKSALAMATTMGATAKGLKDSAKHYVAVLAREEKKFLDAFKSQQTKQVSARNSEIQELEKGIAQREARIKELKKEIETGNKALEAKKNTIKQANTKVQSTRDDFYYAYNIVSSQINDDLAKMNKYLS